MNSKYRRITILLFAVVLVFSAYASGDKETGETAGEAAVKDAPAETLETVTVVDHAGRTVQIPKNPQRIIALNPLAMEALFSLGFTPVAKLESYKIRPEGKALPSVGNYEINLEKVNELEPDLIFVHQRNQGHMVESFEATGAAVYVFNPGKFGPNPMLSVYEFYGKLLDREEEAAAYIEQISKTAAELKEKIRSETGLKSGAVLKPGKTLVAAQNATFYGSVINALGLDNVIPDNIVGSKKEQFVKYDVESFIAADPDFIFILSPSKEKDEQDKILQNFMADKKWAELSAVKNGNVRMLPFKVNPGRSKPGDALKLAANAVLNK